MRSPKPAILLLLLPAMLIGCTSVSPVPVTLSCPKLPPVDPSIMQTVAPHWMSDLQGFSILNSPQPTSSPTSSPQPNK